MVIPILEAVKDFDRVEELRAKLSLKPLLLQGLDEEDGQSKYQIVRQILRDVAAQGDLAVLKYTEQFDRVVLPMERLRVPAAEIQAAVESVDASFLAALDVSIANIRKYQTAMLAPAPEPIAVEGGGKAAYVGMRYSPLERVGVYVPGGAAAYPSSVLMSAVPAQVAGVKELALCSPMRDGHVSPLVLAAAAKVGITEIYAIGGAQAIAAMAFGTATIRAVDKIVGPGNTFVQLAKKELYGIVDIDSFAGPSEVIVLADDSAEPAQVAAELLAQAEHAPGSCLLITESRGLAVAVQAAMEKQLSSLGREAMTRKALEFASALIVTADHDAAIRLTNLFAPEHLQITSRTGEADAVRIAHAGAIFIGPYTPVAAGDYLAGPSHVLPTSGTARFFSGLSAESFRKRTSLIKYDRGALDCVAKRIMDFAKAEGFDAHSKSVGARAQH